MHTLIMMRQIHVLKIYLDEVQVMNIFQSLETLVRGILPMGYVIWRRAQ